LSCGCSGFGWPAFRELERALGPPDLDGVRLLARDEFAINKGHRYERSSSMRSANASCGWNVGVPEPKYGRFSSCLARTAVPAFAPVWSPLFSQGLAGHLVLEHRLGRQLLEPRVPVLELAQTLGVLI
jgi:hypothetical protein